LRNKGKFGSCNDLLEEIRQQQKKALDVFMYILPFNKAGFKKEYKHYYKKKIRNINN